MHRCIRVRCVEQQARVRFTIQRNWCFNQPCFTRSARDANRLWKYTLTHTCRDQQTFISARAVWGLFFFIPGVKYKVLGLERAQVFGYAHFRVLFLTCNAEESLLNLVRLPLAVFSRIKRQWCVCRDHVIESLYHMLSDRYI